MGDDSAVGFYWTLPVPWAGFTGLPADVDAAARKSQTIRYQRELIRRYAKDHGMTLVREEVYLELAPDRGGKEIKDALRKVEQVCRDNDATLLIVDFSKVQGWRSHNHLDAWTQDTPIDVRWIYPDTVIMSGKSFDPHSHFSAWRERQHEWIESKISRAAECRAVTTRLRAEGKNLAAIAAILNERGLLNLTGKPWTGDNLRKFLAKAPD